MILSTKRQRLRRAELIEKIAIEREIVAKAWSRMQQRFAVTNEVVLSLKSMIRNPVIVATAVIGAWVIGPQRSVSFLKAVALGWGTWRHVTQQLRSNQASSENR
jgi:hypothetical protein